MLVFVEADHLIGVFFVAHFHAGCAAYHAGYRDADYFRLGFQQLSDVISGYMALHHITADQRGMAGSQLVGNTVFIFYGLDIIGNDVFDIKIIFF